jgi:TrmH family RNA methyltransferase
VQSARRLRRRAERDATGRFLIEGPVAVAEALNSGAQVAEVFATEEAARALTAAPPADVPVIVVADHVLRSMSDTTTPQGIVAVASIRTHDLHELAADAGMLLLLADVRDPGNAGTLVRTAVAAGASGVVFARGSVDPFHPKTVRSAAGALFNVPVVRDATLEEAVDASRAGGLVVVGADARTGRAYDVVDLTRRMTLVLGNEAWGLPPEKKHLLDENVGIPMTGRIESLNVAVAGSILLFEAARQRRLSSAGK